ncbi:MAG: outer membrane beta-barrel protein [Chitinophagaceae bacterium]
MKKIMMGLLSLVVTATVANAQTDKGDWMVGGNVVISTPKNNSQISFTPSAGYFFANNFVAGALVNVSFTKTGDEKNTDLSVGPFARYYFNLKNSSFKPFLHADYTLGNKTTTLPGSKTTNTTGAFLLGAGGAFFINSNVALEAVAGYNHTKVQSQDPENGFLFRIGFQVHLLGSEVNRVRGK